MRTNPGYESYELSLFEPAQHIFANRPSWFASLGRIRHFLIYNDLAKYWAVL